MGSTLPSASDQFYAIGPPDQTWNLHRDTWVVFFFVLLSLKPYTLTDFSMADGRTWRKKSCFKKKTNGIIVDNQAVKAIPWSGNRRGTHSHVLSQAGEQSPITCNLGQYTGYQLEIETPQVTPQKQTKAISTGGIWPEIRIEIVLRFKKNERILGESILEQKRQG